MWDKQRSSSFLVIPLIKDHLGQTSLNSIPAFIIIIIIIRCADGKNRQKEDEYEKYCDDKLYTFK